MEREDPTPTILGLTLAEGKAILKALQAVVVEQQMTAYLKRNVPGRIAATGSGVKEIIPPNSARSWAPYPVQSLRLYRCVCQSDPSDAARTFSPLAVLLPEPMTPELLFLETKWAALVSYGVTAQLLHEVLPIDETPAPCTIREHVFKVAERLEQQLGGGTVIVYR